MWQKLSFLLFGLALASSAKLPQNVQPVNYDLNIEVNMQKFSFEAFVNIDVTTRQIAKNITLNMKDLEINSVELIDEDDQTIQTVTSINRDEDLLTIFPQTQLEENKNFTITISYTGLINTETQEGFYAGLYYDENYNERYFALTNMVGGKARSVLPCFDEPHFSSTFKLTIVRDQEFSTVSNTPASEQNVSLPGSTQFYDVYNIYEEITTRQLFFMVSDFKKIKMGRLSIYSQPSFLQYANIALWAGNRSMVEVEKLIGLFYPMQKLDFIAVPNRFLPQNSIGSFGAVTFREEILMVESNMTTSVELQNTYITIAKEVSKQLFGRLLSYEQSEENRFFEGLSTYLGYYIAEKVNSPWKFLDKFVAEVTQKALEENAFKDSTASPLKDAPVLRMFHDIIGDSAFKAGLSQYVIEYGLSKGSSSELLRLWNNVTLNEGNQLDIPKFVNSWQYMPGFPLVTLLRSYYDDRLSFEQEQYLLRENSSLYVYQVPINYIKPASNFNDTSATFILTKPSLDLRASHNLMDWVLLNPQHTGFYRVNYDGRNWMLISEYLNNNYTKIHRLNRAQTVDDVFNLARTGKVEYSVALDLAKYVKNENEIAPIKAFVDAAEYLYTMFEGSDLETPIKNYVLNILEPIYNRTGFEYKWTDSSVSKLIRVTILPTLCKFGSQSCLSKSLDHFNQWLQDDTYKKVDTPDTQEVSYCYGNRLADFDQALEKFRGAFVRYRTKIGNEPEFERIAAGLGCIQFEDILTQYLDTQYQDTFSMRSDRDRIASMKSILANNGKLGVQVVLKYLTKSFQTVYSRLGSEPLVNIMKEMGKRITTTEQENMLKEFISTNKDNFDADITREVQNMENTAKYNIEWIKSATPKLEKYFK